MAGVDDLLVGGTGAGGVTGHEVQAGHFQRCGERDVTGAAGDGILEDRPCSCDVSLAQAEMSQAGHGVGAAQGGGGAVGVLGAGLVAELAEQVPEVGDRAGVAAAGDPGGELRGELLRVGGELGGGGEDAAEPAADRLACPHGLRIGSEVGERPGQVRLPGGVEHCQQDSPHGSGFLQCLLAQHLGRVLRVAAERRGQERRDHVCRCQGVPPWLPERCQVIWPGANYRLVPAGQEQAVWR